MKRTLPLIQQRILLLQVTTGWLYLPFITYFLINMHVYANPENVLDLSLKMFYICLTYVQAKVTNKPLH